MPDASGRSQIRDVYVGKTFGSILRDTLDQDGAQVTATQTDKDRIRSWIQEAIDVTQAELAECFEETFQRRATITVESGVSRYALDYDVLEVLRATDADGKSIRCMPAREVQDRLTYEDGVWPAGEPSTIVHEEMDARGRMVVRILPAPTAAATYYVWYTPKAAAMDDDDRVLPFPSIVHPAIEAYVKHKLHERQEDQKMLEVQLGKFQVAIQRARARYKPMRPVTECFTSSYQDRPTTHRAPGRMSHGN